MSPATASLVTVAHRLALDVAAVQVMRALAADGVPSLLIKGPAVAHRLYPDDPGSRPYVDVDLLVAPATYAAAEAMLESLGYRRDIEGVRADDTWWHARSWRLPGVLPVAVDLHRGFTGVHDHQSFWDRLWAGREELSVGGGTAQVPGAAASALLLALHAASPGGVSKPAQELARALEVLPAADWPAAAELAEQVDAGSAFAVGMRLVPAGEELARRLALSEHASPLELLRANGGSAAGNALARLAAIGSRREQLVHVTRRLAPSPGFMRHVSPLARRGTPGLALAYATRLGALAAGAPRGAYEVWRASSARSSGGRRPGSAGALGAAASAVARADVDALRAGFWALRAHRLARRRLRRQNVASVTLPTAPAGDDAAKRVVEAVLRRRGSSCLERELVRQSWFARQGSDRTLVIGVTAPGAGFRAHAWLDGESSAENEGMHEILRRPPP